MEDPAPSSTPQACGFVARGRGDIIRAEGALCGWGISFVGWNRGYRAEAARWSLLRRC